MRNEYDEHRLALNSEIEWVKSQLDAGVQPSAIANRLHADGHGLIGLMSIIMNATGAGLASVKSLIGGQYWKDRGMTNVQEFDRYAAEIFPAERPAAIKLTSSSSTSRNYMDQPGVSPDQAMDYSNDDLVTVYRKTVIGKLKPWVLFNNGTCVTLMNPESDLQNQAIQILFKYGPLYPATGSNEFAVRRMSGYPGYMVHGHHPDILVYVSPADVEKNADDVTIGKFGLARRDKDGRELHVIHVEDKLSARI